MQFKLEIGAVNDPLEAEAGRVADKVMRMPDSEMVSPGNSRVVRRKCAECEEEDAHKLRTKSDGQSRSEGFAPPIVQEVLNSPGQPLDRTTRAFFELRFGADFSHVRVHADDDAAESAQAVSALAYTLGRNIVFGRGQYEPHSCTGTRLLSHELSHVVQQHGLESSPLQRTPCHSGPPCGGPIPGDTGQFDERADAEQKKEESKIKSGSPDSPDAAKLARHKTRATSFEALAASEGVTRPPEVVGFFINAFLGKTVDAQIGDCSDFPDGAPAGTTAGQSCGELPAETEDTAAALLKQPLPRSAADTKKVLNIASTVAHESQHVHFDANASTIVPKTGDCDLTTVIFSGAKEHPLEDYLSEISAEIVEFPVFFQNFQKSKSDASVKALEKEERTIALDKDESIRGCILAMQCKFSCAIVDSFVEQVVNNATASWPADQKNEFLAAMTRILPSFWPQRLRPPKSKP